MKTKILSLMAALVLSILSGFAESGTAGPLTWTFEDGTLTISGTGAMPDYNSSGAPWYSYRSSITTVVINDGVTSIGDDAFYYCNSLTSVTIGNSVTSIGDWAFADCSSLASITIPNSVTSIGDDAFYYCNSLTSVTIGNSVTSIGDEAFAHCSSLASSITIPESVTSIGYWAFLGCSSLTSIIVETDNSSYASEDGVLFNKTKTSLICCPAGKSGNYTIPSSVTDIGDAAFAFCSSLASITIPAGVTSIGVVAFALCSSLTSIIVETDNSSYASEDGVLFNKTKTSLICYPAGKSGNYTIPDSVTDIETGAFYGCSSLTSVTIPNSVTSIGDEAFIFCTGLDDIYARGAVPAVCDEYTFDGVRTESCKVHVPAGSLALYKIATGWKDFLFIEEQDTGIDNPFAETGIRIYPNPVQDGFYVSGIEGTAALKVLDISGKLILSRKITNRDYVPTGSFPEGIYIVKVSSDKETTERKIIKRK
jgi:hypothetical protein